MKTRDGHERIMSKGNDEDEEDLEALRLAALESLRAKGLPPPILSGLKPSPPVIPQEVFQRHSANQNLIAIVPVEVPPPVTAAIPVPKLNSDVLKTCSPVHQPQNNTAVPNVIKKDVPHQNNTSSPMRVRTEVKLNLPQDRYLTNNSNDEADEKPKPTDKFSRFDDSESEESEHDEIEISFTQSDEDEEIEEVEIVVMDDGEIAQEIEEMEDAVERNQPQRNDVSSRRSNPVVPEPRLEASPTHETCRRREASPPSARESARRESPGKYESRRSPKSSRPSSYSAAHRKPVISSRVEKLQHDERRSHDRRTCERSGSADGSNYRSNRTDIRKKNLDDKRSARKSSSREKSSPSSDRRRTEVDDRRRKAPADSRSTEGRENHKKPERATADSPGRRSPQLSESERERLESRKRKFEIGDSIDPLKRVGGKIRLRVCDSGDSERKDSTHSPEEPPEKKQTPPPKSPVRLNGKEIRLRDVKEVAESEPKEKESKDRKAEKKCKRTKDKKKKDKDKRKTPELKVVPDDEKERRLDKSPVDVGQDHQLDLRAELQRRRNHRIDDEEPQRQIRTTPEKTEPRRILVLKSPPSRPPSAEPAVLKNRLDGPSKASKATSCLGSSSVAMGPASSLVSTSAVTVLQRSAVMTKQRTSLLASAKVQVKDQGRDSLDLEDRIRQIRAKNDEIRRRQLEVEADRLKYA